MADLIQSIQDMLKEETWTRATISNYTQNNLKDLANLMEQARNENCIDDVYKVCEDHLSHSKDSIIALYFCGIIDLQRGSISTTPLETLVDIFKNNHKENIVTYLCESILADDENNKFALRTLAAGFAAENSEKVWEIYEKLVRIDFEDADDAKALAEHYESEGNEAKAVEYYKKAILRYINLNNYNACKEVWAKLVQFIPDQFDFFQSIRRKISKTMDEIKTTTLMQDLYNKIISMDDDKISSKWDTAIIILKQNLEVDPKDTWARGKLVDCYRQKYANHTHLEDYIRTSNLTASYRNVFEAINDFEKHIAFDKGCYVFHRNWGVGKIKNLEKDTLTINFAKPVGIREIKLSMAVTALKPLKKDHIWVIKATTKDPKALIKDVTDNVEKYLEIIIRSYDNSCDFKKIKAELVPSILTSGQWTSWNTKAKKILETNSKFGVNPNDINLYTVRENEITLEEKLSTEFKAQKQFYSRVEILVKFFESDETDKTSELFAEMYSYFTGFLKNITRVTDQVLAAYLIVGKISAIEKQFAFPIKETFADLYSMIEDPREIYNELKDSKSTHLRDDFLNKIKMLPNWNKEYIKLFPIVLKEKLISELIEKGFTDDVQKLVRTSFEMYKDYRETVLFFFEKCQNEAWFKDAGISYEKQLITLINIIELTFREINNHVHSTENKKINKTATDLLFANDAIFKYMFDNDEATVKKMYTLLDDIADLDSSYKSLARSKIFEKYPDFKFRVSEEKTSQPKGMIVTAKKLAEKRAEAEEIQNVKMPKNAADVAEAKAKGDLKENAEYKAAREEQHFLQLALAKLQEEINRAVVFDPTASTTALVSFGTVVTLANKDTGKDETYTILGPWESDPDNNVISYMSPFGNAIYEKKAGSDVKFTINEHKYNYTIKEIKKAKDL